MSTMPTNEDICPETVRSPAAIIVKFLFLKQSTDCHVTSRKIKTIGQSPTKSREPLPASLDELFVRARGVPRRRVPA